MASITDPAFLVDKACSLTIDRPDGFSRTYVTRAEHATSEAAKAAAAQLAITVGAIDFLQRGDEADKKDLERAKVTRDADEEEEAVVQTPLGQVYVNMKPTNGGNHVATINKCCRIATHGRVAPFWGQLSTKVVDQSKQVVLTRELE